MKYPDSISSKLPDVGTTIFTVMSKLAAEENAINLSQGFPDFPISEELIGLVDKYMRKGYNQYAPMQGVPELREQLAMKYENLYGAKYDPETEITITAGGTQAIYTAITALTKENDEVIVFSPAYDCYVPAIELSGASAVYYNMMAPDFCIDWEKVKKLVNHRTKMIIINTPHNPPGTIWSELDMQELETVVKNTGIVVLSDEVYEHILFDRQEHQSACRFPGLINRSIIVGSFGKTFHATGWKVGYAVGPENLMSEFRKVHQFVTFAVNHPVQRAIAEYISNPDNYMSIGKMYQKKRDLFLDALKGSRFSFTPSAGTYFQLLDYSAITDEKDTEFAKRLTREYKVASIPVSVFYNIKTDSKVLRFCFAKQDETLLKAAEILQKV